MADQLATKGNVELGKTLLEQAEARYNKERQEAVLAEVQRLMRARDEYSDRAKFAEAAVEWYGRKLKALEAGEFTIGLVPGMTGAAGITFSDPDFNRANF
jgi:hypothetical protein